MYRKKKFTDINRQVNVLDDNHDNHYDDDKLSQIHKFHSGIAKLRVF